MHFISLNNTHINNAKYTGKREISSGILSQESRNSWDIREIPIPMKQVRVNTAKLLIMLVQYCQCPTLRNHFNSSIKNHAFGKKKKKKMLNLCKFITNKFITVSLVYSFLLEIPTVFNCLLENWGTVERKETWRQVATTWSFWGHFLLFL